MIQDPREESAALGDNGGAEASTAQTPTTVKEDVSETKIPDAGSHGSGSGRRVPKVAEGSWEEPKRPDKPEDQGQPHGPKSATKITEHEVPKDTSQIPDDLRAESTGLNPIREAIVSVLTAEKVQKLETLEALVERFDAVYSSSDHFDKEHPDHKRIDWSTLGPEDAAAMEEAIASGRPLVTVSPTSIEIDNDFYELLFRAHDALMRRNRELGSRKKIPSPTSGEGDLPRAEEYAGKLKGLHATLYSEQQTFLQQKEEDAGRDEYAPDPGELETHLADLQHWTEELPTIPTIKALLQIRQNAVTQLTTLGGGIRATDRFMQFTGRERTSTALTYEEYLADLKHLAGATNSLRKLVAIAWDDMDVDYHNIRGVASQMGWYLRTRLFKMLKNEIEGLATEGNYIIVATNAPKSASLRAADDYLAEKFETALQVADELDPDFSAHSDNAEVVAYLREIKLSSFAEGFQRDRERRQAEALSRDITLTDQVMRGGHDLRSSDEEINVTDLARQLRNIPEPEGGRKRLLTQEAVGLLIAVVAGGEEMFGRVHQTVARIQGGKGKDALVNSLRTKRGGVIGKLEKAGTQLPTLINHLDELLGQAGGENPFRDILTPDQIASAHTILESYIASQNETASGQGGRTHPGSENKRQTPAEKAGNQLSGTLTPDMIAELLSARIEGDENGNLALLREAAVRAFGRILGDERLGEEAVAKIEQKRVLLQKFYDLRHSDNPFGGALPTKPDYTFLDTAQADVLRALIADTEADGVRVTAETIGFGPTVQELLRTTMKAVAGRLQNIDKSRVAAAEMFIEEVRKFDVKFDRHSREQRWEAIDLDPEALEYIFSVLGEYAGQFPSLATIDQIARIPQRAIRMLRGMKGKSFRNRATEERLDELIGSQKETLRLLKEIKENIRTTKEAGRLVHPNMVKHMLRMSGTAFNQLQDVLIPDINILLTEQNRERVRTGDPTTDTDVADLLATETYLTWIVDNAVAFANEISPGVKGMPFAVEQLSARKEQGLHATFEQAHWERVAEQARATLGVDITLVNNTLRGGREITPTERIRQEAADRGILLNIPELARNLAEIYYDAGRTRRVFGPEVAGLLVALVAGGEEHFATIEQTLARIQTKQPEDEELTYLESEAGQRGPTIRKIRRTVDFHAIAQSLDDLLRDPNNRKDLLDNLTHDQFEHVRAILKRYLRPDGQAVVYPTTYTSPDSPPPPVSEDENGEGEPSGAKEEVKMQRVSPADLRLLQILMSTVNTHISGVEKIGLLKEVWGWKRLTFNPLEPDQPWGEDEQIREIVPDRKVSEAII